MKRTTKEYIKCYESIQFLYEQGVIDEEEEHIHKANLLKFIIEDMKDYVEQSNSY